MYGHNAVHALIGYLAHRDGCRFMSEVANNPALIRFAREAFIQESGGALLARYRGLDPLFTPEGFAAYADDLLERMMNPWLRDAVSRVIRDPQRKLGWNDRLIGVIRLAMDMGIRPWRFARAAGAAVDVLAAEQPSVPRGELLEKLWPEPDVPAGRKQAIKDLILDAEASAR